LISNVICRHFVATLFVDFSDIVAANKAVHLSTITLQYCRSIVNTFSSKKSRFIVHTNPEIKPTVQDRLSRSQLQQFRTEVVMKTIGREAETISVETDRLIGTADEAGLFVGPLTPEGISCELLARPTKATPLKGLSRSTASQRKSSHKCGEFAK